MDLSGLLNGVQPMEDNQGDFKPLPNGSYNVLIENAEAKENATSGAAGISLKLKVISSNYNNRVLFDYMLLKSNNPNAAKARERALSSLKKIGLLCGSENTTQWAGKKVSVRVGIDRNDTTRNIIWGYGEFQEEDNTPISSNNNMPNITASDLPF